MRSTTLPAILAAMGTAALFETLTVIATQDKAVRAASPWQDDPYDVSVSFALLAVPVLLLAIALRLPAWRAPGGPDRAQQTVRAAGALTAVTGATLCSEWAAVIARAHAPAWNASTTALVAGLAVLSLLTVAVAAALWRRRAPRGSARAWRHDWLGDIALVAARAPVLRRWATPGAVDRVRRHATGVFTALSLIGAAAVIGAQAIGEHWTDPLLYAWACVVVACFWFAFAGATNAVAGFIARPPRTRAETSILAGTAGLLLTTAFRDQLWTAVTDRPVTSVPVLAALTLGAGLTAGALTAALLPARPSGEAR